jgi:hypothetical protein
MAASMVNIGDFRCRDLKARIGHEPAVDEDEAEPAAERPGVLNIRTAIRNGRDNPHLRQRVVLHAVAAPSHRSNLVRFNEPRVAVMRIKGPRVVESCGQASDDYDFPPAA